MAALIDRKDAPSVLHEVAEYLEEFSKIISWDLSDDARKLVSTILFEIMGDENPVASTVMTVTNDTGTVPVDDELPNEFKKSKVAKPVTLADAAPDLYKAWLECSKTTGYAYTPVDFIEDEILKDLYRIGVPEDNFAITFLMNVCKLDFTVPYFKGKPCHNLFTCEHQLNAQFNIRLDAHKAIDALGKTQDLNKSVFFGFNNYHIGSMMSMDIINSYIGIISEFLQLVYDVPDAEE